MKNISLKSDLRKLIVEKNNVVDITKGTVGDFSIEIEFNFDDVVSSSSYIYNGKDANTNRDLDYEQLLTLILE